MHRSLPVRFCNLMVTIGPVVGRGPAILGDTCQTESLGWHGDVGALPVPAPLPAFWKCPIWQEPCPAAPLKVLVQIPPSKAKPVQILNGPNYTFQIVSSHIVFRENRGLCFINSPGGRWRKLKSRMRAPLFPDCGALGFCPLTSCAHVLLPPRTQLRCKDPPPGPVSTPPSPHPLTLQP